MGEADSCGPTGSSFSKLGKITAVFLFGFLRERCYWPFLIYESAPAAHSYSFLWLTASPSQPTNQVAC